MRVRSPRRPPHRLRSLLHQLVRWANRLGRTHQCYICDRQFLRFEPYRGGSRRIPEFRRRLGMVGSDVDNFRCIYCGANDRERHLFMYFDAMQLWEVARDGVILHFAPEAHLSARLRETQPALYICGDLHPVAPDLMRIDATDIPFADETIDLVIANHVLEHIPDYQRALAEIQRVLKGDGLAVLQTPCSRVLTRNFDDEGIASASDRAYFHGQEDHVRTFSERALFESIQACGLTLRIASHATLLGDIDACRFGVNSAESFMLVQKPAAKAGRD